MPLNELPIGLALLPCDMVIEDKRSSKKSLIGLFSQLHVPSLPYVHPFMYLYVSLTGGCSVCPCEMCCIHEETRKKVFSLKCQVTFKGPMEVSDMVFELRSIRFEDEGRYLLCAYADETLLMSRPLTVLLRRRAPEDGK